MTVEFIYALVASVAALLGATAGRVLAVEAENVPTAILAATYVGAGAGLASALPLGSLLTLGAQIWGSHELSTMFDALDVTGSAMVWGTAAGAAGGFAVSVIVGALKLWQPRGP